MLTIKSKDWEKFINALAKVNKAAAKEIEGIIGKGGLDDMDLIALVGQVYRVTSTYGEAAAALTCEMYDAIAVAQNAKVPPAEPARPITLQEVKDTVNYALSRSPQMIPAETGKLVKKMSTRTMRKNAARDGAKMALVPSGDGCAFCKMLGSRGWESARASKSFEAHLHSHCRCEYVVRFNGDLRVEGYDPDALYDEFMSLEGDTWEEKMNSMRRAQYAEKNEQYQIQKKTADERRKHLENVENSGERGIMMAEKGLEDQPNSSIRKSIRKIEKSKKKHEDKIRNPQNYIEDWDGKDERYREGMIRYWRKEIEEKDRAIKRRKEKLRERGEIYE